MKFDIINYIDTNKQILVDYILLKFNTTDVIYDINSLRYKILYDKILTNIKFNDGSGVSDSIYTHYENIDILSFKKYIRKLKLEQLCLK